MKKVYNKLVRDKIPEIIIAAGKEPETRIARDSEFKELLKSKLLEEANEYIESNDPEELADILEVLQTVALAHNMKWSEVEEMASKKRNERGGFSEGIVLVSAEEEGGYG